ncbi:hypothetical protein DFS33DRAFT_1447491 [Desarmillaria ectypa]|nr:hypothetical protein DFS33DRAFT_1447491 [Desarmillaria ectypa]
MSKAPSSYRPRSNHEWLKKHAQSCQYLLRAPPRKYISSSTFISVYPSNSSTTEPSDRVFAQHLFIKNIPLEVQLPFSNSKLAKTPGTFVRRWSFLSAKKSSSSSEYAISISVTRAKRRGMADVYVPKKLTVHRVQVKVAVKTRPFDDVGYLEIDSEISVVNSGTSRLIVVNLMKSLNSRLCNRSIRGIPNILRDIVVNIHGPYLMSARGKHQRRPSRILKKPHRTGQNDAHTWLPTSSEHPIKMCEKLSITGRDPRK